MSTEEFRVFLAFIATMTALIAGTRIVLTWIRRPRGTTALPPELIERLERIERAVDATALEVERIGEGQRFLTRALGERSMPEPSRVEPPGRIITPH
jgi:hypothetical protein